MEHNFEAMQDHILPLSSASDFYSAKNEWRLIGVEIHDDFDNCPKGVSLPLETHDQSMEICLSIWTEPCSKGRF